MMTARLWHDYGTIRFLRGLWLFFKDQENQRKINVPGTIKSTPRFNQRVRFRAFQKLFCYAKLIELSVLLRSNILEQNYCSEAKEPILLLLRRRIVLLYVEALIGTG